MPNCRIASFMANLCRAVKTKDAQAFVDVAEFPHALITDAGTHVFATPSDLFGVLSKVMASSGTVLACSAEVRDVRPFGPDLFVVEYDLIKETKELGRADNRRQFTILRQTGDEFRCLACYYVLDAMSDGMPDARPLAA